MSKRALAVTLASFLLIAALAGAAEPAGPARAAQAWLPERWLPVDKDGWTILKPSADTRLIYVSSSQGDDATGASYAAGADAVGADPFRPAGQVRPFKTIAAAQKLARDGFPDWVLLRRGDAWREDPGVRSGRSPQEPSLLGAYGPGGARPMLLGRGIGLPARGFRHLAIVGLDVYCVERDPASPEYVSPQKGGGGLSITLAGDAEAHHLLVEDCAFRMTRGLTIQERQSPVGTLHDIAFRRCLVLDSYPSGGHCQGMFAHRVNRMLLEENVFDHDGWITNAVVPRGGATMFNHDTYFGDCSEIVFRGNMFLRAASMGNKWRSDTTGASRNILIDDNLYVEGEIGIGIGGNTHEPLRFANVIVTNNVLLDVGRSRPTGRTLGWYIEIQDWDGGLLANNCVLHQASDEVKNSFGIQVGGGSTRNVLISGNMIHGIKSNHTGLILVGAPGMQGIRLTGNAVQFAEVGTRVASAEGPMAGFSLTGNAYFTSRAPSQWFAVDGKEGGFDAWTAKTGERDAARLPVAFLDPHRTVETYMASLGGQPSFDAFIAAVRSQSKERWDPRLTASAVNDYVRAGFGMTRMTAPVP